MENVYLLVKQRRNYEEPDEWYPIGVFDTEYEAQCAANETQSLIRWNNAQIYFGNDKESATLYGAGYHAGDYDFYIYEFMVGAIKHVR